MKSSKKSAPQINWTNYWRESWLNWTIICACGASTLILWTLPGINHQQLFWLQKNILTGTIYGDPTYELPQIPEILDTLQAALVSLLVPLAVHIIFQSLRHDLPSLLQDTTGHFTAMSMTSLCEVIIKRLNARLRPNFFATCKPNIHIHSMTHNLDHNPLSGYAFQWYNISICTTASQSTLRNALESFPSGHSSAGFAGFGFLALCLMSKTRESYLMLQTACFAFPLLAATLIACAKVSDYSHHPSDVVGGGLIGASMAVVVFVLQRSRA